jgi:CHAT domain-containing protein
LAPAFEVAESRRARQLLDDLMRANAVHQGSRDGREPGAARAAQPTLGLHEVAFALPGDSVALLEYVTGQGREPTTLFLVTRERASAFVLAPQDSLAAPVSRFASMVRSGTITPEYARRLGDALIGPVLAAIPERINALVIVPDGVLHHVPFDALGLPDGRWAVERAAISLVPSAAVAMRLWAKPAPAGEVSLLALGDPVFASVGAEVGPSEAEVLKSAFAAAGGLPRLAASGREVRAVARFAPRATIRTGQAASEAFLKRAPLHEYRVLHLATHALVDDHTIARTALALAPGEGEDGFLTVTEVAELTLGTDLVVLSACRTAVGAIVAGEGMQGLTAPLLRAGARAIAATRWPVDDRSTAEFVEQFYGAMATGLPVGQALRDAKLRALQRGASSALWASFILVGDPFVRLELVRHRGWAWWPLVVAALMAAALGYGLLRKRRRRAGAPTRAPDGWTT